jgi:hypothetical protein
MGCIDLNQSTSFVFEGAVIFMIISANFHILDSGFQVTRAVFAQLFFQIVSKS